MIICVKEKKENSRYPSFYEKNDYLCTLRRKSDNMRQILHIIYTCAVLLMLAGCGDGKSVRQLPHLGNTPYQQDTILMTYATNPERALTLLDSALLLGNISDYRGQVIRARIYSKSLAEQRLDSAIIICKDLLEHDSVRYKPAEQENILDLLIATSRAKPDYEQYLHWSTQKAGLCQQQGQETERWRTEADIGLVMTHLGQEDEGLAKLDEAISHLDAPGSIDRMDAFIVAVKRKINALNAQRRYEEVIPLAQRILDRLDHFESHIKDYAEDSYRLSWNDNPSERDRYLDFSRAQAWGFMAIAYSHTQNPPKGEEIRYLSLAKKYLSLFDNSGYGKTFSARRMISPAQMALGMYDEALVTYDELERRMAGDTLNEDYAIILRSRAIAAREKRNFAEALGYQTRYADLSKAVSDSLHRSEAHDYAARYHAYEQQLEIQEKEAEAECSHIISIAVAVIALLAIAFAVYFFYQKRIVNEKNRGLVRLIDETIKYKERFLQLQTIMHRPSSKDQPAVELKSLSEEDLFQHLCEDIRENRLYLDPQFDRQAVCDRYNLSTVQVGSAFAQGSDYSSVADFIRDCRLEHARILLKTTDMKVAVVAAASGFSRPTTFNHDFKARFNLSPTEYRRQ